MAHAGSRQVGDDERAALAIDQGMFQSSGDLLRSVEQLDELIAVSLEADLDAEALHAKFLKADKGRTKLHRRKKARHHLIRRRTT